MHELSVTESVLNIALKHAKAHGVQKVLGINLRIGALSDLENEWIQRYFDYLSKGTLADGALLKIERVPASLRCDKCGQSTEVNLKELEKNWKCPACNGEKMTLSSGREFYIKNIEVL
jgi:hydrogenase nickel incorporation protein HypA/HybF